MAPITPEAPVRFTGTIGWLLRYFDACCADVAAREVRVAAGGERDDEGDRLGRIALRERLRPRQRERCDQRESCHLRLPLDARQSTAARGGSICSRR